MFRKNDLVGLVQFGRFGLTCLVWQVGFGLGNGYNLTWPMVPLEVVIASLELNLGTIPVRVGLVRVGAGRFGLVRFGPIVIIRLCSAQLELELG